MKKVFKNILALSFCAVVALGFASCSDDDDNSKFPIIDPVEPVQPTDDFTAEGYYKGNIAQNGSANLWINFVAKTLTWDADEYDYTGTGDLLCLDFNTVIAENPDFAKLADGTYTPGEDYSKFTFNISDYESYVVKYVNSSSTELEITDGTIVVSTAEQYTVIEAKLTLSDGSDYDFHYIGKIPVLNRSGEGNMSNLTENIAVTDLTQGVAMYFGEAFTTTSDHYILLIAGDDYDLEENFGSSPSLMLGLNVAPGSTDGIPSGTYTVIDALDADDYEVGTALSGFYEPFYGGYYGAWYFHYDAGLEAAMATGTITVTNKGNGNYDVKFDLVDGYGHTVKGSYSGPLALEDLS